MSNTLQISGKAKRNKIVTVNDIEIAIRGRFIKIARVRSDWNHDIEDPEALIEKLKEQKVKADVFSFMQRLPETNPKFRYHVVWDNVAAIPVETLQKWFSTQIRKQERNRIKRAKKSGVVVRRAEFNDAFVKEMAAIINETPIRQGRRYWHYGKDLETIKREHMAFLEKSTFFGAYFNDELIGFIKLIDTGKFMTSMGIIGMIKHRDKSPMNALVARAVELCAEKKMPYLMYDKAEYGKKKKSTLWDFKRYNGYQKINIPRYYIPLTLLGRIAVTLRLYRRANEYIPEKLLYFLLNLRKRWYGVKDENIG